ncbi:hypothetical protein F5Y00DRAFT_260184 [Daldinia vernicosa]|uniref:uncharacterized protein n=1 Tax=Daldinia vernicosa TaxID=114800 RepID=UPI00200762C3|nr:uncharacterized protein F5Y00DRAFT_260184 [Daldinia vernicosa]KAI0850734.1 hypothetical protein F5Y00DRAFT_260184 [Daldinia vernicosa]
MPKQSYPALSHHEDALLLRFDHQATLEPRMDAPRYAWSLARLFVRNPARTDSEPGPVRLRKISNPRRLRQLSCELPTPGEIGQGIFYSPNLWSTVPAPRARIDEALELFMRRERKKRVWLEPVIRAKRSLTREEDCIDLRQGKRVSRAETAVENKGPHAFLRVDHYRLHYSSIKVVRRETTEMRELHDLEAESEERKQSLATLGEIDIRILAIVSAHAAFLADGGVNGSRLALQKTYDLHRLDRGYPNKGLPTDMMCYVAARANVIDGCPGYPQGAAASSGGALADATALLL